MHVMQVAGDCACLDARHWLHCNRSFQDSQLDQNMRLAGPSAAASSYAAAAAAHADGPERARTRGAGLSGAMGQRETSSAAADARLMGAAAASVPVGQPIDNMALFIAQPLSGDVTGNAADVACSLGGCQLLRRGALGEVCVAGIGVAEGYVG